MKKGPATSSGSAIGTGGVGSSSPADRPWLLRKAVDYVGSARSLGPINALRYRVRRYIERRSSDRRPYSVRSKLAMHPLWLRPGTSDALVFEQIFIHLEYACLDDIVDPKLIIDCGANVGLASAYLLSRFPEARAIAVEPDPANFAQLVTNLKPYGDRARAMNSAIWSHPTGLVIDYDHGDGMAWSRRVIESGEEEKPDLVAIDIGTILTESGADSISILKIDVEGSEGVIFAGGCESWIDRVENIAIEIHGDENAAIFHRAIAAIPFMISHRGEFTVCKRPARQFAR